MREIKFRAWDKERNKFRYGNDNLMLTLSGHLQWDFGGTLDCIDDEENYTIEQYTGLKDKNGKEIYEGDIIERSMGISAVTWGSSSIAFGWMMPLIREDWAYGYNNIALSNDGKKVEVIGNVHENPELLEETE